MRVEVALRALGGTARWHQLKGHVTTRQLAAAVKSLGVTREGRAYCLPTSPSARQLATAHRATRSHTTAAEHWGWALPPDDGLVRLTVPFKAQRTRKPADVKLRYRDLDPGEVDGTSPVGSGPWSTACATRNCASR